MADEGRARAAAACACEPPSAADQPARALLPPHMCAAAARGRAGGAVCAHLTCGRLPHQSPIWGAAGRPAPPWRAAARLRPPPCTHVAAARTSPMTPGVMCVRCVCDFTDDCDMARAT